MFIRVLPIIILAFSTTYFTPLGAQDRQADSLLLIFNSAKGVEQVSAACELYKYHVGDDPTLALDYLLQGRAIAREIHDPSGEARTYRYQGDYFNDLLQVDSSNFYFREAVRLYQSAENNKEVFSTLIGWSRLENLNGNFGKAHDLINEALEVAAEIGTGDPFIRAYQQQSSIFLDQGDFKSSIESLISARRILDTLAVPDPVKLGMVIGGIGRNEVLRNHPEEALPYLEESLALFEEHNEIRWQAIMNIEIGSAYFFLKDFDKALDYYNRSLTLSYEMKRDDFVAANLGNIAAIYLENGEYDEALTRLFEAQKINSRPGSINNLIIVYNDIGSAYAGKKSYDEAILYYTKAIDLADSIGSLENLMDAYIERSEMYELTGEYAQALEDFKLYQTLNDSIFNATKARQIEELKTVYETEKKEQQIALLEQEALTSRFQRLLLITGLGLSFLVFGLIIYGRSQKSKRNKLEREKLQAQLEFKKKELTTHALSLAKKNELLDGLKQKALELKKSEDTGRGIQQLIHTIDFDMQDDKNWDNFRRYFEEVHQDFNSRVKEKFEDLTSNELRLLALMKMNLSSKEIANILNISPAGIKKARYRLRKKLQITTDESLQDTVVRL
jgi:tetratricopeptide (TPR) repeat protein